MFSERATVVPVGLSSASAAIATVGNATAVKCADGKHGSNSYAPPIAATSGRKQADEGTGCASAVIDCGGPMPA